MKVSTKIIVQPLCLVNITQLPSLMHSHMVCQHAMYSSCFHPSSPSVNLMFFYWGIPLFPVGICRFYAQTVEPMLCSPVFCQSCSFLLSLQGFHVGVLVLPFCCPPEQPLPPPWYRDLLPELSSPSALQPKGRPPKVYSLLVRYLACCLYLASSCLLPTSLFSHLPASLVFIIYAMHY